ncbi:MAG: hypothetical protein ACOY4K_14405 [Pseudomonadota bacterium]
MKRIVLAAIAASLLSSAAAAADLVDPGALPARIDQSRFELGYRLAAGASAEVVSPASASASDVVLCNTSDRVGGYRLDARHRPGGPTSYTIAARSCVALYGVTGLVADTGEGEGWSGAVLVRRHGD